MTSTALAPFNAASAARPHRIASVLAASLIGAAMVTGLTGPAPAQDTAEIQGTVSNPSGKSITFIDVVLVRAGIVVGGATSDLDGNYTISGIEPDLYTITVNSAGYASYSADIKVSGGIVVHDIELQPN